MKTVRLIEIPLVKRCLKLLQVSVSGRCVFIKMPGFLIRRLSFLWTTSWRYHSLKRFSVFWIIISSKSILDISELVPNTTELETPICRKNRFKKIRKIINAYFNCLSISRFKSPDKTLYRKDLHGKPFWLGQPGGNSSFFCQDLGYYNLCTGIIL